MRKVISLEDGTRVDIDGCNVRHVTKDGKILYSTSGVEFFSNAREKISYFFFMGEYEREKVRRWLKEVKPKTIGQDMFINHIKGALRTINYDYQIATLEPSFDSDGNIFYKEGQPVALGITYEEWEERAKKFYSDDEWHSELALLHEGDLFKAYRVACGYWSLESICDNSGLLEKYCSIPNTPHEIEPSGARTYGGFRDGVGNTYQIFKTDMGYAVVGGRYNYPGRTFSTTFTYYTNDFKSTIIFGAGVITLKRNQK